MSGRFDSATLCACGHDGSAHEHFRPGTDCALCRPEQTCSKFRRASSRMRAMLRRAARGGLTPEPVATILSSGRDTRIDVRSADDAACCLVARFMQARAHLDDVIENLLGQEATARAGSPAARIPVQRSADSRGVATSIAAAIEALDLAYERWLDEDTDAGKASVDAPSRR